MVPKTQRVVVQPASNSRKSKSGYFASAYEQLTASENASVVRSVAIFGVSIKNSSVLFVFHAYYIGVNSLQWLSSILAGVKFCYLRKSKTALYQEMGRCNRMQSC